MWVYLRNGQSFEFPQATVCKVNDYSLALFIERQVVATFRRRDVVSTSEAPSQPSGFN